MLRLLYPAYTWGLFEGKNFPTGQMNAILACISWFGFSLFCEVQFPSTNYWGVFCILLCSLILAEGFFPLTTSLISFVSWFLVFPTKSCIFSTGIEKCVVFINETSSSDHHDYCRITCSQRRKEATGPWSKQYYINLGLHTLLVKLNLLMFPHIRIDKEAETANQPMDS